MEAGEWGDIAQEFAEQMGYQEYPWVAVKHGPDHIHVVLSRVSEDPAQNVWTGRKDRWAAQQARRVIEQAHGLSQAPLQSSDASKRVADHQLKQGEWKHAEVTGRTPVRVQLAAQVATVAAQSAGHGRAAFEEALSARGIVARVNVASKGRVSGYSFATTTTRNGRDKEGALIWFKASQLDKQLSWSQLGPVLETPRALLPPAPSPGKTLFGKTKQWPTPIHQWQAEQQWQAQVTEIGQGWQLVTPAAHDARLSQALADAGQWWQHRGAATTERIAENDRRADAAWRAARPPAWSDLNEASRHAMLVSSHGFPGHDKHIEAMKREDTIRAAEKGNPDAIATITGWAGPGHAHDGDLDQIVALARQSNVELENAGRAIRWARLTPRPGTTPTAARPYQPPTPSRDRDRGYGR
ncbi:MAG: hypothetical protein M3Y49_12455 [Actinomycetota bacterium]|nr:hypothetical protein [Actinomycetota bacterium]